VRLARQGEIANAASVAERAWEELRLPRVPRASIANLRQRREKFVMRARAEFALARRKCGLRPRIALGFTLLGAALAFTSSARANGRFPNAEQLREEASGTLVVSGTYGLLVSANAKDFQFVCESALFGEALQGSWVDPLLEVLPDDTILSGSVNGLRVSRDQGCSFRSDWSLPHDPTFIPPDPSATGASGTVVDLCLANDASRGAIALTSVTQSDGSILEHRLYRTADQAKTWSPLGVAIPSSMVHVVLTVDVAPSDSKRIYVSGSLLGKSVLVVSDDAGASWTAHPLTVADGPGVSGLYVAAVSPSDPERVYLRVNRKSQAEDGSTTWDDSLLVSDDGGVTASERLRQQAALLGFALSSDGKTVLVGYGDPVVAPIVVNADAVGLYAASADTLTFSHPIADFYVSCLRYTASGLYACAKESDPLGMNGDRTDFHVGVFKGAGVPGALSDFTPLLKLKDLRGPLPLASGQASACAGEWANGDAQNPSQVAVCTSLNACAGGAGPVPLSPGAIVCGATPDAGLGVGTAGAQNAGGATSAPPDASAGASAIIQAGSSGGTAQVGSSSSGCGCRVPANERSAGRAFGFWLALGLASRRARRRITIRRAR
jgi:hypothetical protein